MTTKNNKRILFPVLISILCVFLCVVLLTPLICNLHEAMLVQSLIENASGFLSHGNRISQPIQGIVIENGSPIFPQPNSGYFFLLFQDDICVGQISYSNENGRIACSAVFDGEEFDLISEAAKNGSPIAYYSTQACTYFYSQGQFIQTYGIQSHFDKDVADLNNLAESGYGSVVLQLTPISDYD